MVDTYPRVLTVGDRAVTVELGAALDEETVGRVRALDERLREAALPGVLETVPTYASLLVIYDRRVSPGAELRDRLLALARDLSASNPPGRLIEIPVLYDGEDLEEVAASCGLARSAVIELHSGRDYSVLMLGFDVTWGAQGRPDWIKHARTYPFINASSNELVTMIAERRLEANKAEEKPAEK